MATQPDLNIEDPYELDDDQFNAAVELLKQQKQIVGEYWSDAAKQIQSFASDNSTAGTTWQYQVNQLQGAKPPAPVDGTLPEEGSTGWSDTWMIASKAAHPNCMYLWMNYIISPEANAKATEYFGEAPVTKEACSLTQDKNHCTTSTPMTRTTSPSLLLEDAGEGLRRRPGRRLQGLLRVDGRLDGDPRIEVRSLAIAPR